MNGKGSSGNSTIRVPHFLLFCCRLASPPPLPQHHPYIYLSLSFLCATGLYILVYSMPLLADEQCCGIRDVYPGSRILIFTHPRSRTPDLKTATKERCEKIICRHTFFSSHKFHKIKNYFIFEMLKKKI